VDGGFLPNLVFYFIFLSESGFSGFSGLIYIPLLWFYPENPKIL
jgi:hypothetical protein